MERVWDRGLNQGPRGEDGGTTRKGYEDKIRRGRYKKYEKIGET